MVEDMTQLGGVYLSRVEDNNVPPDDVDVPPMLATLEDEAAIWAQLEEARDALVEPKHRIGDFVAAVRGGKWTFKHKGVAADSIKASARGEEAKTFCKSQKVAKSASFYFSTYGQEDAAILARAWAAKMQFCFNLSLENSKLGGALSQEQVASWQEPSEFVELASRLPGASPATKRIERVRQLLKS